MTYTTPTTESEALEGLRHALAVAANKFDIEQICGYSLVDMRSDLETTMQEAGYLDENGSHISRD